MGEYLEVRLEGQRLVLRDLLQRAHDEIARLVAEQRGHAVDAHERCPVSTPELDAAADRLTELERVDPAHQIGKVEVTHLDQSVVIGGAHPAPSSMQRGRWSQ